MILLKERLMHYHYHCHNLIGRKCHIIIFFPYYIVILCTSLVSIGVKAKQRNWNKAIISQLWLHINEQILDYIR